MLGTRGARIMGPRVTACLSLASFVFFGGCFTLLGLRQDRMLISTSPLALKNSRTDMVNFKSRRIIINNNTEEDFNKAGVAADDRRVVKVLRNIYLDPPSSLPYNLVHNRSHNPSLGQAQLVDKILQQKRGGFFIESGGFDGESYSNSLFLERERGWSGIMIEADFDNYANLVKKNRKVYSSRTCLARTPHPKKAVFSKGYFAGRVLAEEDLGLALNGNTGKLEYVQCFPLYSYLAALNRTQVDYFSLDVEGAEYDVLRYIPWHKVDISVLSVEYHANNATYQPIIDLMEAMDYEMYTTITHHTNFADDFIFVKKNILKAWGESTEPTASTE